MTRSNFLICRASRRPCASFHAHLAASVWSALHHRPLLLPPLFPLWRSFLARILATCSLRTLPPRVPDVYMRRIHRLETADAIFRGARTGLPPVKIPIRLFTNQGVTATIAFLRGAQAFPTYAYEHGTRDDGCGPSLGDRLTARRPFLLCLDYHSPPPQGDFFLILDHANRVPSAALSVVAEQLRALQATLAGRPEAATPASAAGLGDRRLRSSGVLATCAPMDVGENARCKLPAQLEVSLPLPHVPSILVSHGQNVASCETQKRVSPHTKHPLACTCARRICAQVLLRPTALSAPDTLFIAEALLAAYAFSCPASIASKMVCICKVQGEGVPSFLRW